MLGAGEELLGRGFWPNKCLPPDPACADQASSGLVSTWYRRGKAWALPGDSDSEAFTQVPGSENHRSPARLFHPEGHLLERRDLTRLSGSTFSLPGKSLL